MGTHPIFESDFDCLTEKRFWESQTWLNLKVKRWQAREKFPKVDLDHDPIDDDHAVQHLRMIHHHVEDDDLNLAADQEADLEEDEVDLDLVVGVVVVDHDLYRQQNIKNSVILAIAKIQPDRDALEYLTLVDALQKRNLEEFLNDMVV